MANRARSRSRGAGERVGVRALKTCRKEGGRQGLMIGRGRMDGWNGWRSDGCLILWHETCGLLLSSWAYNLILSFFVSFCAQETCDRQTDRQPGYKMRRGIALARPSVCRESR